MDTAPLIASGIALGALVLNGIVAIFTLWQARTAASARADAETANRGAAQHEQAALAAEQRAAAAAERAARAAEQSAEAQEGSPAAHEEQVAPAPAQVIAPSVRWELYPTGPGSLWAAENTGTATARGAQVLPAPEGRGWVHPQTDEKADVEHGEKLAFLAIASGAGPATVRIVWTGPDDVEQHEDWRLVEGVASPA